MFKVKLFKIKLLLKLSWFIKAVLLNLNFIKVKLSLRLSCLVRFGNNKKDI